MLANGSARWNYYPLHNHASIFMRIHIRALRAALSLLPRARAALRSVLLSPSRFIFLDTTRAGLSFPLLVILR